MISNYENIQKSTFSRLIRDGSYSEEFEHASHAQEFFYSVMRGVVSEFHSHPKISVLDCGCGNGAWLDFLDSKVMFNVTPQFYGFDLTPEMVDLSKKRLCTKILPENFKVGSILDDAAYVFPGRIKKYDIIFTYDVVQQLPGKFKFAAINEILSHLNSGGIAAIFDNDDKSLFGRVMALKKFATKYLGAGLVPYYFCNAKYPPLARYAKKLKSEYGYKTEIKISKNKRKRCLIIKNI